MQMPLPPPAAAFRPLRPPSHHHYTSTSPYLVSLTICLCFGQVVSRLLAAPRFPLFVCRLFYRIVQHCATHLGVSSRLCNAFNETPSSRPLPFWPQSQTERIGCAYLLVYMLPKGISTGCLAWSTSKLDEKIKKSKEHIYFFFSF